MVQKAAFHGMRFNSAPIDVVRRRHSEGRAGQIGLMLCLSMGLASCSAFGVLPEETRGIWQSNGDGSILDIGALKVAHIEQTSISCVRSEEAYNLEELYGDAVEVKTPRPDELRLRLIGSQVIDHFKRVPPEEYRSLCPENPSETVDDPELNFEIFWHTFNENYAFFDRRGVDWKQTYDEYRDQVDQNTDADELLTIFANMVAPLRDGHISIEFGDEDMDIFDLAIDQRFAEECETLGKACDDHEDYIDQEHDKVRQIVTDNYLDGNATSVLDDEVFWGRLSPQAGYLYIGSIGEFTDEDTILSDLALLEPVLNRVFDELGDLPGLVVDLRFNGGGYDEVALAIANRFADERRPVFEKSAYTRGRLITPQSVFIEPSKFSRYHGNVAVLIGPYTASAAEILTLAFQTLPKAVLVGKPTEGIMSDILGRTLPMGAEFSVSNEIYTSATGEIYEGQGIPPAVDAPFLPLEDRQRGVDSTLDTAISLLTSESS